MADPADNANLHKTSTNPDKIPAVKKSSLAKNTEAKPVASKQTIANPQLPKEVSGFTQKAVTASTIALTTDEWLGALHGAEIKDKLQQISLRPWFAGGVFLLLGIQNLGIWFIVNWALDKRELSQLQPIFIVLVSGTLTQSYFVLKFITNKIFDSIDYHNGGSKKSTTKKPIEKQDER